MVAVKNLFLWYVPQAALFAFGFYVAMTAPEMNFAGAAITGAMLAAAYTGGVNLFMSVAARLRRHRSQPTADGQGLATGGRLLGERAQQRQSIGVDKDFR